MHEIDVFEEVYAGAWMRFWRRTPVTRQFKELCKRLRARLRPSPFNVLHLARSRKENLR